MHEKSKGRGDVRLYPRFVESIIRLSEAHTKVRLSNKVERNDVEKAIRLFEIGFSVPSK